MLAVLAHLDTVFPEGHRRQGQARGHAAAAPGIGDDTRGLALMLAVDPRDGRRQVQTPSDILFVGNVGEEGEGDLRGVKYLLRKGKYKDRIKQFIAIDGGEQGDITRGGVGSKRYRVTFKGPGGHSYGAFGLVNPAFAMGSAIAKFSTPRRCPSTPKTTFNVGVVRGGTSVNSIPSEVSMDVDMRSESCAELTKVDDDVPRDRARGGGRGEPGALDARRADRGRSEADRRAPVRRDADWTRRSCRRPPPRCRPSA